MFSQGKISRTANILSAHSWYTWPSEAGMSSLRSEHNYHNANTKIEPASFAHNWLAGANNWVT